MRKPLKIVQWRIFFFVILLLAATVRFYAIIHSNYDESTLSVNSIRESFYYVQRYGRGLYEFAVSVWNTLFGGGFKSLFALNGVFSFLTIFPIFGIARNSFNKRVSYVAILIYSLSFLSIHSILSISSVSLFVYLSTLSTYYLLMIIRKKEISNWVFYFLTLWLLMLTDLNGALVVLFQLFISFLAAYNKRYRYFSNREVSLVFIGGMLLTVTDMAQIFRMILWKNFSISLIAKDIYKIAGSIPLTVMISVLLLQLFYNSKKYRILYPSFSHRVDLLFVWLVTVVLSSNIISISNNYIIPLAVVPFSIIISSSIEVFESKQVRIWIIVFWTIFSIINLLSIIR